MLEKIKLLTRKIYKYSKPQDKTRTTLFSSGFHGDKYLLELAGQVLKDASVFIETGTNMGSASAGSTNRPCRAALRHANRCWDVISCRRATSEATAPGA